MFCEKCGRDTPKNFWPCGLRIACEACRKEYQSILDTFPQSVPDSIMAATASNQILRKLLWDSSLGFRVRTLRFYKKNFEACRRLRRWYGEYIGNDWNDWLMVERRIGRYVMEINGIKFVCHKHTLEVVS